MKVILLILASAGNVQFEFSSFDACETQKTAIYTQYTAIDRWQSDRSMAKSRPRARALIPPSAEVPMIYCIVTKQIGE